MSYLNAVLRPLFDGLLYPFRNLPPIVGLVVVSAVVAVGMLFVFKATSNQDKLAAVKRRIHACLFEIRLFNDDLRAILRAQMEILRHNMTYLGLSTVPMLWMIVPLVLVIAQLQFHYGYAGLQAGKTALLDVALEDGWREKLADPGERPPITVEAPPDVRIESPAVWIPALNEMTWRVVPEREGNYELRVTVDGTSYSKSVVVSNRVVRRSPSRLAASLLDELIYPAEAPLPRDGPLRSISVTYPEVEVSVFGWHFHWLVVFFVLSIVFAFALRNRLGVTI
jgi:uncharacterized membrane protein (DUF106 family)